MATDTHSEFLTLIAFPRYQWLRERGSILRFTYFASLALISVASIRTEYCEVLYVPIVCACVNARACVRVFINIRWAGIAQSVFHSLRDGWSGD